MILHHNIITRVQDLLEDGYTVELCLEKASATAPKSSSSKPQMPQLKIFKRPNNPGDLNVPPMEINEHAPTDLVLFAIKLGEEPIQLATFVAPAAFYLTGIKGYQGISQEMEEGKEE